MNTTSYIDFTKILNNNENPFPYIRGEVYADACTSSILESDQEQSFWQNAEQNLLSSVIWYVHKCLAPEMQSLRTCRHLVTLASPESGNDMYSVLVNDAYKVDPKNSFALSRYKNFALAAKKTREQVCRNVIDILDSLAA